MSRRKAFFHNEQNNINIENIVQNEDDFENNSIKFKNSVQYKNYKETFVSETSRSGNVFNNLNNVNTDNNMSYAGDNFSIDQIENKSNSRYILNDKKLNNFLKFSHKLNYKKDEHITKFKDLIETKKINQEEARIKASAAFQESDTEEKLAYLMAEIEKPKLKPMEIFFYNGEMLKNKSKKAEKSKKSNKYGLEDIKINEIQNVFMNNETNLNFNLKEETPTGMDLDDYYKNIQDNQKSKEIDKNCIIY